MIKEKDLLDIIILSKDSSCKMAYHFQKGDKELYVKEENNEKFNDILENLYSKLVNKDLVSFKYFKERLMEKILNGDENFFKDIKDEIYSLKETEYKIIQPMYGIIINSEEPIKISRYKFIKEKNIKSYLKENWNVPDEHDFFDEADTRNLCFVEIICKAKEKNKAKELAKECYVKLDNVIRFMYGILDKNYGIGTFNYRSGISINTLMKEEVSGSFIESSGRENKPILTLTLDDKDNYFFSKENGNYYIWELLNKKTYNKFEDRLLMAIDLIGNGINQIDDNIAFLQFVMAIECILQNEKDFITKSITAHISEYGAFIIADEMNDRIFFEKEIKQLYKQRSTIAHGSNSTSKDLNKALWIAKQIVIAFFIKTELKNITTSEDLQKIITKKKFS